MPIAQDMKSLTDKIVTDYDDRISVLGNIFSETHDTLKGFNLNRVKMAAEQEKELAKFAADLANNVKKMLKELQNEHKKMAEALEEILKTGETNRLKDFKAMLSGIQKRIQEIDKEVSSYMAEVRDDMASAAEAWQKMAGQMDKARQEEGAEIEGEAEVGGEGTEHKKKGKKKRRKEKELN